MFVIIILGCCLRIGSGPRLRISSSSSEIDPLKCVTRDFMSKRVFNVKVIVIEVRIAFICVVVISRLNVISSTNKLEFFVSCSRVSSSEPFLIYGRSYVFSS